MLKKYLFVGLLVFVLAVSVNAYAADTELILDSADQFSGFTVKDSNGLPVMRVGGDGNLDVNGVSVIDNTGQWVGDPTGLVGPEGPQGPIGLTGAVGVTGPLGGQQV